MIASCFIVERAKHYSMDQGHGTSVVNAVFAAPLTDLPDLALRLKALTGFMRLPQATSLVAANKRIGNILRKSGVSVSQNIVEELLTVAEERTLFDEVSDLETKLAPYFESGDYTSILQSLAGLENAIASFFDGVMVMDEDPGIRSNRLTLLSRLKGLFDRVADLALAT